MKYWNEMNYFEKLASLIDDEIREMHTELVKTGEDGDVEVFALDDLFDWFLCNDGFSSIMDERNAPEEDYENDDKCREIFDEAVKYVEENYTYSYYVGFEEDEIVVEL